MIFGEIYFFTILIYIIYLYSLWFSKKEDNYQNYDKPFSVIIPCYNETPKYLFSCISSVMKAKGDKQIILVDNNSNKEETLDTIDCLRLKYPNLITLREKRQGKRYAHSKGLRFAKHEIIVFIDSDTMIKEDTFIELIKPFQNEKVGGVCGNLKLANRDENIFTKMLSAMFWTGFNLHRKATTSAGYMAVMSGALSSYRKKYLLALEDEYTNQTFMGKPCSISDDRFLTMRIQTRFGKSINFAEKSIGYTYMPKSPIKFWRTLERWRRGALRETILSWKEKKGLMFFDINFNAFILTIVSINKIFFLWFFLTNMSLILLGNYLVWFVVMVSLYSSILIIYNPKEYPYKLLYSLFYEFFFVFTFFSAIWNIRNQSAWATR